MENMSVCNRMEGAFLSGTDGRHIYFDDVIALKDNFAFGGYFSPKRRKGKRNGKEKCAAADHEPKESSTFSGV